MDSRVAFLIAIICGAVFACSTTVLQCLALIVFPTACALGRKHAVTTIALFFLAACLPVLWVVHSYTQSVVLALVQYLILVSLNTLVIGVSIFQRKVPRTISLPLALVLVSISPLSSFNPVSLLPLAGWLFPGMKFGGILMLLLLVALSTSARRWGIPAFAVIIALSVPISNSYALQSDESLFAINLVRPYDAHLDTDMMRIAYRYEELDRIALTGAAVVVLPESVFGEWRTIDGSILSQSDSIIYGGARLYRDTDHYVNVLVDAKTGNIVYEQQSAPLIGRIGSAQAVSGNGEIVDTGLSFLICYELTNAWIALSTFSRSDRSVVWASNLGWFNSQYLENRMRSVLTAWSRLFSVPTQSAVMSHD